MGLRILHLRRGTVSLKQDSENQEEITLTLWLVSELLAERMLAWRHTGFSAHSAVRLHARDAAGRRRLAQYMLRAPFSQEKMSYEPVSGIVIYRSRMHKTFKRNLQIMFGADWLAQLCRHIPDRFEHVVRYAGWYSNRTRGEGEWPNHAALRGQGWIDCLIRSGFAGGAWSEGF